MANLKLKNPAGGSLNLVSADGASDLTVTFPAVTGTAVISGQNSAITSGTAVASTSGTSIDFTSIPSWVKRVTVMFNGVSLNGNANYLIQIGSGSISNTGYTSLVAYTGAGAGRASSTAGFIFSASTAGQSWSGQVVITLLNASSFIYCESGVVGDGTDYTGISGGTKTLSGVLDRVRVTTSNGTDTFDAGSVNILYE